MTQMHRAIKNTGDFGVDSWPVSIKGFYILNFNDNATKLAPYVGIDSLSIHQHGYSEEGQLARDFKVLFPEKLAMNKGENSTLIAEYLRFYNTERFQKRLGQLSPVEYREKLAV